MAKQFSFKKAERICSKKQIDLLFLKGKSVLVYPLKLNYIIEATDENATSQILVVVSKRKFKRANKRNLFKRRIREAFRLNKHILNEYFKSVNLRIYFSVSYIGNEELEFSKIQSSLVLAFQKIIKLHSNEANTQGNT